MKMLYKDKDKDKEELHNRTLELIKYYHKCMNSTSIKACAYNGRVFLHSTEQKVSHEGVSSGHSDGGVGVHFASDPIAEWANSNLGFKKRTAKHIFSKS
jgi:hypothetical protein